MGVRVRVRVRVRVTLISESLGQCQPYSDVDNDPDDQVMTAHRAHMGGMRA